MRFDLSAPCRPPRGPAEARHGSERVYTDPSSPSNGVRSFRSTFVLTGSVITAGFDDVSTAPAAPSARTTVDVLVSLSGTGLNEDVALQARRFGQLHATARFDGGGQDVTATAVWTSSNPGIAAVATGGVVTAAFWLDSNPLGGEPVSPASVYCVPVP